MHSKCGLLGGFSLDDRRARMFEDLLADLGQTKPSRRSIKQSYAEPLLQQRNAPTDSRFWHSQRAGGCREPAIENDGRKELKIVEIAHHDLSIVPSAMGRQRRPLRSSAGEDNLRRLNPLFDGIGSGGAATSSIFGAMKGHGDVQDHCVRRRDSTSRPCLQQGSNRRI